MKQTIEIEVPEGKKAIWKDDKIIFEDIAPKLPETWEEFCELYPVKCQEYFIDMYSEITGTADGCRVSKGDKNLLPSLEAAEAHLALMQLHQLRDCYRQGWTPDWGTNNSNKYCIEFANNKCSIFIQNHCTRFLSFQSREIAEKFLNNFKDLIEQAGDLI